GGDGGRGGADREAGGDRVHVRAQGRRGRQARGFLAVRVPIGRARAGSRDRRRALDLARGGGSIADLRGRAGDGPEGAFALRAGSVGAAPVRVLNFYSSVFADQLRRGRKTATIRLGDKSHKYRKNDCELVKIGYQHSQREKIFQAVIDQVEVKRVRDLSPRDIEHDNPEFRRIDEMVHFLEQIYGRTVELDDTVTVVRFSQIIEHAPELRDRIHGLGGAQN